MAFALTKSYPINYPSDVVEVLNAMSFTDGASLRLLGSSSLRSQQYAGDYDGYELVDVSYPTDKEALKDLARQFQHIIKRLKSMKEVYIGDIKGGVVAEWRVLPLEAHIAKDRVVGYNAVESQRVIDRLQKAGLLTDAQVKEDRAMLKPSLTPTEFVEAKAHFKYHIVRWTVADVMAGEKRLQDGSLFTLEDAFSSPGITKLDVIALVQKARYTDFSVIYQFRNNGRTLNPEPINFLNAIQESILSLKQEGNPFKILKRQFSLARFKSDKAEMERLSSLLNSDLGRLYMVLSDIGTLINLLKGYTRPPMNDIRYEIDQFKGRLSNIYALEDYIRNEQDLLADLNSAVKITQPSRLAVRLERIEKQLMDYLQKATEAKMRGGNRPMYKAVHIQWAV